MTIRLKGDIVHTVIIQVYLPTSGADKEEVVRIYELINQIFDELGKEDENI